MSNKKLQLPIFFLKQIKNRRKISHYVALTNQQFETVEINSKLIAKKVRKIKTKGHIG